MRLCAYDIGSEWVSSVLRPHQHSIGYTGDGIRRFVASSDINYTTSA